jgi:hypothetical protein
MEKTDGHSEQKRKWAYFRADQLMIQISEFGPVVRIGPSTSTSIKTSLRGN